MQVILNEDVKKVGYKGESVEVKRGYAMNFLLPNGLAQIATAKLLELTKLRNEKNVMKKQQVIENASKVIKKLNGLSVTIKAKVSDKGHLYGSISEEEVLKAIADSAKLELSKENLKMTPIKELGDHKVKVNLGKGLEERILVVVEAA